VVLVNELIIGAQMLHRSIRPLYRTMTIGTLALDRALLHLVLYMTKNV